MSSSRKNDFDFKNSTLASSDYTILLKQAPYYNSLFTKSEKKNRQHSISNVFGGRENERKERGKNKRKEKSFNILVREEPFQGSSGVEKTIYAGADLADVVGGAGEFFMRRHTPYYLIMKRRVLTRGVRLHKTGGGVGIYSRG